MKIENDIVLIINEEIAGELRDCNRKFSPIEACGLIFGEIKKVEIDDGEGQIHYIGKQFYCLKSNVESLGSFNLIQDSDRYFEIHQEAVINNKLRLMSIFHSHPVPAYPSPIDSENMKFLDKDVGSVRNPFKNLIWTIMDMNTEETNSFIYFNDELLQTKMQIRNS